MPAPQPQFALVDVNNFFASCERVFRADLENTPLVVLSNNDGCAIARSKEAKEMGVKMGTPWFKLQPTARKRGLLAFSSNYALYGDMSQRVVRLLRDFAPDLEVYSIDECFLRIESVAHRHGGASAMGRAIRERIRQWLGLPVCVGIGPTKTLAKFANHLAKKNGVFDGVCDLYTLSRPERKQWMSRLDVGEVWGVGRRIARRLDELGIHTVLDLREASPQEIRGHFGVVMERTCQELRGISCLELEDISPPKQQIMVSRSFGCPVRTLKDLREAVATFTARAAEKLRQQAGVAAAIHVFIRTDRFREDEPQYTPGIVVPLADGTDDTLALLEAAFSGLCAIYREGFRYKKAGVMLTLISDKTRQPTLFGDTASVEKSKRLMLAMDAINREFGRDTLRSAASGMEHRWATKAEMRSPRYTTRWDELPGVS
ncbi:DNA polymerase V subunit UmuC [Betaproteobacteria bacterium]|nr:DNA polymerase V subunit UmuC [Betaproteobacteria bacterium]